jgi:hypothetical protein
MPESWVFFSACFVENIDSTVEIWQIDKIAKFTCVLAATCIVARSHRIF